MDACSHDLLFDRKPHLRLRALLPGDGAQEEVRFERVAVGST